jgi:hypothetical protein
VIHALDHGRHADDVRDADTPLERGNRVFGLEVVGRHDAGSVELANVISLSTGTAVFTLTGAQISTGVFRSLKVTSEKCTLKSAQLADGASSPWPPASSPCTMRPTASSASKS